MSQTEEVRIAKIADRERKALPGPWAYEPHGDTGDYGIGVLIAPDDEDASKPLEGYQECGFATVCDVVAIEVKSQPDADFIAHARSDIPYLLERLGERDRDIAGLVDLINRIKNPDEWIRTSESEMVDFRGREDR